MSEITGYSIKYAHLLDQLADRLAYENLTTDEFDLIHFKIDRISASYKLYRKYKKCLEPRAISNYTRKWDFGESKWDDMCQYLDCDTDPSLLPPEPSVNLVIQGFPYSSKYNIA